MLFEIIFEYSLMILICLLPITFVIFIVLFIIGLIMDMFR